MNRTSKIVVGGSVTAAVLFGGTAVAMAQGEPSSDPAEPAPVTITLSPEQVSRLCETRLPRIEKRVDRLVERITGDENTRGSAAWLRARADRERDAGRETTAQVLDERADRREGHVDQLNQIKQWLDDFSGEHCGPAK